MSIYLKFNEKIYSTCSIHKIIGKVTTWGIYNGDYICIESSIRQ